MSDIFGSVSFMDQGQGQQSQDREEADFGIQDNPGRETPKKWKGPKDIREQKGAGQYPNYWSYKSRSGHSFIFDDSEGNESITIQHRGGSAMQFLPNGAVHMVSNHGNYQVVFGEKRMTITGAHDMTVKGDGSMRVYGHYNKTIHGDKNETITGSHNMTAENVNHHIRGNRDIQARNETKKIEGNVGMIAGGGISHVAKGPVSTVSQGDSLHMGGSRGIHAQVDQGNFTANVEKGNFHMGAKDGEFNLKTKQAIKMLSESGALHAIAQEAANILAKSGKVTIKAQGGDVHMESGSGAIHNKGTTGVYADAAEIHWNSGKSQSGGSPEEAQTATGQASGGSDARTSIAQMDPPWGDLA